MEIGRIERILTGSDVGRFGGVECSKIFSRWTSSADEMLADAGFAPPTGARAGEGASGEEDARKWGGDSLP